MRHICKITSIKLLPINVFYITTSCKHTLYNLHSHDGSVYTKTEDVYTYEYDDQGRLVKATVVPGDAIEAATGKVAYRGEAAYAKAEHELVYGDYYIYNGK